jgi:26S proteasome regulatory subunit N9
LAHPILKSLNGSKSEWLVHFLVAFNSGDMKKFEQFLVSHQSQIQTQGGILKDSITLLREKVAVLALMELVFNKQSDERTLPFSVVAEAANLPIDAVSYIASIEATLTRVFQCQQCLNSPQSRKPLFFCSVAS